VPGTFENSGLHEQDFIPLASAAQSIRAATARERSTDH
jgi:hypothetical protein